MAMSSWKIHVNLAIVSVAFFCNMLSYMTMEGEIWVHALIYSSFNQPVQRLDAPSYCIYFVSLTRSSKLSIYITEAVGVWRPHFLKIPCGSPMGF